VRVGFWSGVHYGGCLLIPYRTRTIGLDILETQVTAGGELPTLDVVVSPVSGLVKLVPDDTVWGGLYLRVGPQLGYSFARSDDAHRYFRFGGHVGIGYELDIASNVALRILDARFVGEATGNRADREGHRFDLGVLLSTGIVFK
jgi:hypothetical protein